MGFMGMRTLSLNEWVLYRDGLGGISKEAAERNDLNRLAEQLTDFLERTEIKHSLKENIELILTAGYSMGAYQAELIHLMKGR